MNILVTGANGQLGKEIKKVVDKMGNGHADHTTDEKNYYIFTGHKEFDITNEEAVDKFVRDNHINVIVNCAAYTNVNGAQDDRDTAYNVNALGALNLAFAAGKVGAVLIQISTDYVFGKEGHYNTPLEPISVNEDADVFYPVSREDCFYGFSKMVGEDLIEKSDCRYIIFRTSWLYSVEGKNFVKTMFNKSLKNEESNVVFDEVGSPTNAEDLARFIVRIIEENDSENRYLCKYGTYNYCNEGVTSWFDFAKAIYRRTAGNPYLVHRCKSADFAGNVVRPHYSVLDMKKTEEIFDETPKYWLYSLEGVINELLVGARPDNSEYDYGHNVSYKEKD